MDHTSGNNPPGQFQNQNMQYQHQPPQEPGSPKKKSPLIIVLIIGGVLMFFALIGFIIILAILAPNFIKAKAQGQLTACKSNVLRIGTACEMYSTDHDGRYPKSLSDLLKPTPDGMTLLKSIPVCPACERADSYGYIYNEKPDFYRVWCKHSNHSAGGIAPEYKEGFPQFDSNVGLIAPRPGETLEDNPPPPGSKIGK